MQLSKLPQIQWHHSAHSVFDHGNAKANIRTGPSAFASGEDTQSIQNLFVKLINGFFMLNQRFHLRDRQLIQLDQTFRLGQFLMDQ
jgi:hypothetical protein